MIYGYKRKLAWLEINTFILCHNASNIIKIQIIWIISNLTQMGIKPQCFQNSCFCIVPNIFYFIMVIFSVFGT